ncbi:MAG: rRNA maturation RNase YbeY [Candidatus Zixiibacteriota bacterium]|nr:MAG: rRNA maturation RNase YbeY [candidate division Zixibacteria bacterium]
MKLVIIRDVAGRIPSGRIRKLFDIVVAEEADPDWHASVNWIVTSSQKIRSLNRRFRGIDRATDVLSFNIDSPESAENTFGEIYISASTTLKQARIRNCSPDHEYLRLTCHGLLHLFGYAHEAEQDATAMLNREAYFRSLVE